MPCAGRASRSRSSSSAPCATRSRRPSPSAKDIAWVVQEPQRGTGHAAMVARPALKGFEGDVVVLVGDAPMIRPETVRTLLETHRREQAAVTLVTAILDDPKWFGRIVRDAAGNLLRIVEAKDASAEELKIREVNPAYYAFRLAGPGGGARPADRPRTPSASIT